MSLWNLDKYAGRHHGNMPRNDPGSALRAVNPLHGRAAARGSGRPCRRSLAAPSGDGRNDFCYEAVLSWDFVHRMHKVPGNCRPPRHIPCGWGRKNPSTYKWFSYKPVFPQKNLQTKFDKAMASRILKTYPVIWAIAASCLAEPSMSSYTGFGGGDMLEQNRQNAYAKRAGTARA